MLMLTSCVASLMIFAFPAHNGFIRVAVFPFNLCTYLLVAKWVLVFVVQSLVFVELLMDCIQALHYKLLTQKKNPQVCTQKPHKRSEVAHPLALMWPGDIPAHMDQMIPHLTEVDVAITMCGPINIELSAILPNGSMACNAAAKVSGGGELQPQHRHPRLTLVPQG
jgi:hypothetical protein